MNHSLKESNLFSNCSRGSCYLRFVYDRKPTARTSAPGSSPSSSEPDHIQVIPTVIVPKRKMGTQQKPKHFFGFESTSRGPDNKPSNMEADLLELLFHSGCNRNLTTVSDNLPRFGTQVKDLIPSATQKIRTPQLRGRCQTASASDWVQVNLISARQSQPKEKMSSKPTKSSITRLEGRSLPSKVR
ncbi:hypothetical protein HPB51_026746 [Rhipicephalus microplus]|uniref:Uncharacterized protein n=1 Tax=Rhipicephalus microplus TaxID=6941 RepID=A0A9J6D228_RHIMP|nr:hypothetical protein HPB51_026746 [Rhipicephalus microplus]